MKMRYIENYGIYSIIFHYLPSFFILNLGEIRWNGNFVPFHYSISKQMELKLLLIISLYFILSHLFPLIQILA